MGFFDKLKSMKNAITGGGAKVFIDCDAISYTGAFQVRIRAEVADADLEIKRVYLKLSGEEEVEVPDVDVLYDQDGEEAERRVENVYAKNETVNLEINVAGAEELKANNSYEWIAEVTLPSNAPSIYKGKYCQHIYSVLVGLDAVGNDPDSGWVELFE
jgi:hypothetical protein